MIKIGIVGIGYWGPNYVRVIRENPELELVWCCDADKKALKKFHDLYPWIRTTSHLEDLLEDTELDAVIVVTPAQTHFQIVASLLKAGKHVLVEKPLTAKLVHAENLNELAKLKKKILMVDHTFIFNSSVNYLKQLMMKNELGRIYYVYGMYNALGPIRKDVSAMWDLPHFIYLTNYLLGENPSGVYGVGRDCVSENQDDVVFLNLTYPSGVVVNLSSSWIDPVKIRRLIVVGSKKMAVFDDMEVDEKLKIYNKGIDVHKDPNFANLQMTVRTGEVVSPKIEHKEPLKEVVGTFVQAIKDGKVEKSSAEEGYELVKILEAADKSIKKQVKIMIK